MKKWILLALTVGLIFAHQDFWHSNWETAQPLLGDFLPVGLWYHMAFCVAAAILMALFVALEWPNHLETEQGDVVLGAELATVPPRPASLIALIHAIAGMVIGGLLGVPLSYYFQAGFLRAVISLPGYIREVFTHINDVGSSGGDEVTNTLVCAVVACAVIGALFGAYIGHKRRPKAGSAVT